MLSWLMAALKSPATVSLLDVACLLLLPQDLPGCFIHMLCQERSLA